MIRFTSHAIDRYIERVRPALDPKDKADRKRAFAELRGLEGLGQIVPERPAWVSPSAIVEAKAWLTLGDVAFPLIPSDVGFGWACATCITRGTIAAGERAARKSRKARRGTKRRTAKVNAKKAKNRRRVPAIDEEITA